MIIKAINVDKILAQFKINMPSNVHIITMTS